MIQVKEIEAKWNAAKRNITLKDILVSELKFVDADGEDLTDKFLDALPEGIDRVTLKASFELNEPDEEIDVDDLAPNEE